MRNSGSLGPKRREGDRQIPEGFYFIDRFNPRSRFFLSLGLNYPNRSDRILGHRRRPGGDIFIHGGCGSKGCIAITDDSVEEVFWLSYLARKHGQRRIPVHIFPFRMSQANMKKGASLIKKFWKDCKRRIGNVHPHSPEGLLLFWENLRKGYIFFEKYRIPPSPSVLPNGLYGLYGF